MLKRLIAGTLATYLNTGISILSNLILVPMYLNYLGKEQYGLWLVVLSLVSYFGFLNLGITQSVANLVAGANAKNNLSGIRSIVATGFWLFAALAFIAALFLAGLFKFIPMDNLIKVSGGLKEVIASLLIISSLFFLLKLPLTVFRVALRSLNLIYKEQLFVILGTVIQFLGVLLVLVFKIGLIGLAVVYGSAEIIASLIIFMYLVRLIPGLSLSIKLMDKALVKKLIKPSLYFFLLQFVGASLIWGADNIIIAVTLGVSQVAPYAIAFRFFMMCSGVAGVITANMLPAISASYESDKEKLSLIYLNALKVCFAIGILSFILLMNIGPALLIKWVGVNNYVGDSTFYLFVWLIFIQAILFPADAILMATGQHSGYAKLVVLEGLIKITLSLCWVHSWGILGIITATLISRLCITSWYMFYKAAKVTGLNRETFIKWVIYGSLR
ncbi:MAG TPA: polysaccharide biosynthesis C-terminal domain-containing protein [Candidatus Omnitrophota bacterium]|nr:polysaccharide biosynthesis C-terminal domain-containing protein [Candidatus Omnitrophota bacterium]